MVSAKKAYELIVSEHLTLQNDDLLSLIWGYNIPLNMKCFTWLAVKRKINTWDNRCKRGWSSPNRCCLCKTNVKSVDHIFVGCPFVHEVIHSLSYLFDVHLIWFDNSLADNLNSWVKKNGRLLLAFFLYLETLEE